MIPAGCNLNTHKKSTCDDTGTTPPPHNHPYFHIEETRIDNTAPDKIQIEAHDPLTGDHTAIIAAMTITIDGGLPFHPVALDFSGAIFSMFIGYSIQQGQSVEFNYTGNSDLQDTVHGKAMEPGTHQVDNQVTMAAPTIESARIYPTDPGSGAGVLFLHFSEPMTGDARGLELSSHHVQKAFTTTTIGFDTPTSCGVPFTPEFDGHEHLVVAYDQVPAGGFFSAATGMELATVAHIKVDIYT